ncbi:hypothetical protein JYU34_002220 [Plutella xylostella]|uniref:Uncharacterized protein n=1 Tax=Plutella xylostella TaxID=51655 RepID=A0ABQ7R1S9_PLUXY|nr:hypothetical protein JYU34_002220 [Plutella xylostella]
MDSYGYPYGGPYGPVPPDVVYPDHGDGLYYPPVSTDLSDDRYNYPRKYREHRRARSDTSDTSRKSRLRSRSETRSRSKGRSRSRSRTRSTTRSRTRSRSRSRSKNAEHSSASKNNFYPTRELTFLDSFRVLYLTPSGAKKNTTKYLATKKHQDRIQQILKSDGLGSKHWLFYPRPKTTSTANSSPGLTTAASNTDQRVKLDGHFFRDRKRGKNVDASAPVAKLKRWELIFYKKLGFIQAV